jgi:peptidoglycan L-alanyl-D-glutamate endopeptidase CwlK
MPRFGRESRDNLDTCHPDLQRLFIEVVRWVDCSVLYGHKNEELQNKLFNMTPKVTKVKWPDSTHNTVPSDGIDVVPYPIIWPDLKNRRATFVKDMGRFYMFDGFVMATAKQMGIEIISGSDWDRDFTLLDQTFNDLAHFQRVLN